MWKNIYGPRGGWILIGVTCLVIIVYPHLEINGLIMGGAGSVLFYDIAWDETLMHGVEFFLMFCQLSLCVFLDCARRRKEGLR